MACRCNWATESGRGLSCNLLTYAIIEVNKIVSYQEGEDDRMISFKRIVPIALVLSLAIIVAACGSSSTGSSGGRYGGSSSTTGNSSSIVIQTAAVTVKGKSMTVLTNAQGRTLYYLSADSATKVACSGG